MLEQNEYEKALKLFHQAANECRDIQSLNNLAWIYFYEEENEEKAFELIMEAVKMNPSSYFPYNILGEIYIKREQWQEAKDILEKSISIQPSNEAFLNLAGVYYQFGDLKKATKYYLQGAGDSDFWMYSHVKCLIDLGRTKEAKEKLDLFNNDAEDFVGEIEVADLYAELNCFKEAVDWFEKGYNDYWKSPNWISRFVYVLFKTNNIARADEVINEAIALKNEEIKETMEEEVEENWTEEDKKELIKEYTEHLNCYKQLKNKITSGYVPKLDFEPDFTGGCYLFGCKRHGHPEYRK